MIIYKIEDNTQVSESEMELLKRAKSLPVIYDEDSPELTEKMEEAFIAARKNKPIKNVASQNTLIRS